MPMRAPSGQLPRRGPAGTRGGDDAAVHQSAAHAVLAGPCRPTLSVPVADRTVLQGVEVVREPASVRHRERAHRRRPPDRDPNRPGRELPRGTAARGRDAAQESPSGRRDGQGSDRGPPKSGRGLGAAPPPRGQSHASARWPSPSPPNRRHPRTGADPRQPARLPEAPARRGRAPSRASGTGARRV